MPVPSLRRAAVAVTATAAAAALTLGGADAALAAPAKTAATPVFHAYDTGKAYKITYSTRIEAGYLKIVATNTKGHGSAVQVASFAKGYDYKHYLADYKKVNADLQSGKKGATKEFRTVLAKVHYWGGPSTQGKSSETATLNLPDGQYAIWDDGGDAPAHAHLFSVVGKVAHRATPKYSSIVTMVAGDRFGGSNVLPAKGTIRIENKAKNSPHFLVLIHVKKGTTRQAVLQGLRSNTPPSFVLQGEADSEVLNPGTSQWLSYSVPSGEYVELCFFPDPQTGMPHAFMGMIRFVTVK